MGRQVGQAVRDGRQGPAIAAEFESVLANLDEAETLNGTLEFLRVEEFDSELAHLVVRGVKIPIDQAYCDETRAVIGVDHERGVHGTVGERTIGRR